MKRPFNEAKYKALLEGLEVSEVLFSEINDSDLMRLEAEFYTSKTNLLNKSFLGKEIIKFVQYGTSKGLNEDKEGYPILRLNEFRSSFIGKPAKYCKLIDKATYNSLKLKKDDVLICRTNGNPNLVGKAALVPIDYEFAYASYLFKVRPKRELINSATLVAFLNSKYGRNEINKFSMVSNQANFSPAKFREIKIPDIGGELNRNIEITTYEAFKILQSSDDLYSHAENLLLQSIGLKNFHPTKEFVNVKSFKDSFVASGRLDAEYYQPKYEDYLELIYNYSQGAEYLENIVRLKDKNFIPKENINYKYIELADIGKSGEITGCTFARGDELPSRARRKVNTDDVIISSIEGSLESCALVNEEYDNSLCSTGFYVINSDKINAETLLVLFKSELMQNILKQHCSGTILTAINKNEFLNIPLPLFTKPIQDTIKDKIQESMKLRKQSEQLLETAKRAVEIAIGQDEEKGLEYIETVTKTEEKGAIN